MRWPIPLGKAFDCIVFRCDWLRVSAVQSKTLEKAGMVPEPLLNQLFLMMFLTKIIENTCNASGRKWRIQFYIFIDNR